MTMRGRHRCDETIRSTTCRLLVLIAVLAFSSAPANASVRLQPIVALGIEGPSLGDAQLQTSSDGEDVVVTMSAPVVALPPGAEFRLVSCAQTHVDGAPPAATCGSSDVDTRQQTTATVAAAPVAMRQITAPPAGTFGWASGIVEVLRRAANGAWQRAASSWAPGALATTALALTDGGLPQPLASQGVALEGVPDGGVNSGARDSICQPVTGTASQPLPAGVTSGALGAQGPAYSETGAPTTASGETRGVVLLLHGGGWLLSGSWAATGMRPDADRWRARGWRTVNASYRACGDAIDDVIAFVDHINARIDDRTPLCVVGTSAGAHLALLAAALRPAAVDCVVSQSGPTDLAALAAEQTYDPVTGGRWTAGPIAVHNLAAAAFGTENLTRLSPAHHPISARMLVAIGEHDWLLAPSQATAFASAQRALNPAARVQALVLQSGAAAWGHGAVSPAAIDAFHQAEAALAEATITDKGSATSPPIATSAPPPVATAPVLPATVQLPTTQQPALALSLPRRASSRYLAAGGTLRVRIRTSGAGRLVVTIRMHGSVVARTRRTTTRARSTTVALRLNRRTRAHLRHARRPPTLRVTATLRDHPSNSRRTTSRIIQLAR